MAADLYTIPTINTKGNFKFKPPYNVKEYESEIFTVDAIRSIKDMIASGEDPYKGVYQPIGMSEADYNTDSENKVPIVVLKGSNNSDRRDAMLKHEIGHQKLHNIHPDNKTVDNDKRSINQYRSSVSYLAGKDKDKLSLSMDDIRDMNKYFKNATNDPSKIKERDDSLNAAKKYASDKYPHAKDVEYEADRYSANHSSEGSIKRGIRNTYKVDKQSAKKSGFTITPEKNREIADDIDRRSRALKDKKLKGSKVYK